MFSFTVYVVFGVFCVDHKLQNCSVMPTAELTNDNTGSTSPLPDVTDDSCRFQYIEIVPCTTDGARECEVKPELLPVVEQEPDDLCGVQFTEMALLITDDGRECHSRNLCSEVKPEILPVVEQEEPDDLCGLQFTEIVPLTTDDVYSSTTKYDSSILCFQVKPEVLGALKLEPDVSQV